MTPQAGFGMLLMAAAQDFCNTAAGARFIVGRLMPGGFISVEEICSSPEFLEYYEHVWLPDKERRGIMRRTSEGVILLGHAGCRN